MYSRVCIYVCGCVKRVKRLGLPLALVGGLGSLLQLGCGVLEPVLCLLEVLLKKTDPPCERLDLTLGLKDRKYSNDDVFFYSE